VAALFPGRRLRLAIVSAVATSATHLLMHLALPQLVPAAWWLLAGEAMALAVEATAYALAGRDLARALVASGLANAASFAAGWLLLG